MSATVQKYCIYKPDKQSFRNPTTNDVQDCNVVITTLATSLTLTKLNLTGFVHMLYFDTVVLLEIDINKSKFHSYV